MASMKVEVSILFSTQKKSATVIAVLLYFKHEPRQLSRCYWLWSRRLGFDCWEVWDTDSFFTKDKAHAQ
jgi:hypothetical protein